MLVHYVRNMDHIVFGVVVALDKGIVGWSQCHSKKDKFDKERGLKIAIGRAEVGTKKSPTSDYSGTLIYLALSKMEVRSQQYFKIPPHEFERTTT